MAEPQGYQPLADIAIDEVRPEPGGFTLTGRGRDRGEYRVAVHFDMPLDARTRAVLGELLSQSEVQVARRPEGVPELRRLRRDRAKHP
jgi:hypothetical protein